MAPRIIAIASHCPSLTGRRSWVEIVSRLFLATLALSATSALASQLTVSVTGLEQSSGSTWDQGTLTITVNGHAETFSYGQFSSAASVASGVAARFSQDCASSLVAKAVGNAITFTEKHPNGTDVQLNATVVWNSAVFNASSFTIPLPSGASPSPIQTAVNLDLTCTPNPVPAGSSAVCAAQMPSGLAIEPTGTVTFSLDGAAWSAAVVDNAGLSVSTSLASLSSGSHNITAQYSGDGSYTATYAVYSLSSSANSILPTTGVYSFSIAEPGGASGYAPNSNIIAYTDSVNGTWGPNAQGAGTPLGYDSLNRLISATQTGVGGSIQYSCWSYDSFGNMEQEYASSQPFTSQPGQSCQSANGAVVTQTVMNYTDGTNRVTSGAWRNSLGTFNQGTPGYDGAKNINYDLQNTYLYDPEGHVCAMQSPSAYGVSGAIIGYLYDAEGRRVAKGSLSSLTCDPTVNNFQVTSAYIIGPDGQEMTEVDGSGNWVHTNASEGGQIIATYKNDGLSLHFRLNDWLGSLRVQTDYLGQIEESCQNQLFGDQLTCTGANADPSGHHFTGKERDTESGNDYFGARYYASTMGRWMSPDPSNLGADIYMPQTLNKYNYAVNNPLTIKDANGLWPFYIHNEIINESFPGMSKQDLQGLKNASWNMDFGKGQQDPSNAFEHGMRDGPANQDPMVAQQKGDDYISSQVQTAQQAQADWEAQGHTGIAPAALTAFGNALHTATDRTSPSHQGNQPWYNDPWYNKRTRTHVEGELNINDAQRAAARNAAQQLFRRTFGNQFLWMLQKEPCFTTSASDNHGNSTGSSGCQ